MFTDIAHPLIDPRTGDDLAAKYDTVAYAAQANPLCHPDHLATVATLFGLAPADVGSCRVLELGCNDGANLLPMAATLPEARFTGCDISPRAIDAARAAAGEAGLSNVTLLEQDLRALAVEVGEFDYIIAHGVYSWVPSSARDALFALASRHLAPNGVMFVSYNTFPGCHIRRAAWDVLHFHVDRIEGAPARLAAARALAGLLAQPGFVQNENDGLLRGEFRRIASQTDSALFHDDLAQPNDPVYFHEFAAHAARHDLAFLAEAKLSMMSGIGLAPAVQQFLTGLDRLAREQYLDFALIRRFRQSLVCRAAAAASPALLPERAAAMHVGASSVLVRAAAEGRAFGAESTPPAGEAAAMRALLQWLLERAPCAVSVDDARRWLRDHGAGTSRSAEAILVDACISGVVDLHVHPPAPVRVAGERPVASPLARWQARRQPRITNLRHETLTLADATARRCLALLDGSRNRKQLAEALGPPVADAGHGGSGASVDECLAQFARLALLLR